MGRERHPELHEDANPGLLRILSKMATCSGKTLVMAMLIAWHTLNKIANLWDTRFTDTFLIDRASSRITRAAPPLRPSGTPRTSHTEPPWPQHDARGPNSQPFTGNRDSAPRASSADHPRSGHTGVAAATATHCAHSRMVMLISTKSVSGTCFATHCRQLK